MRTLDVIAICGVVAIASMALPAHRSSSMRRLWMQLRLIARRATVDVVFAQNVHEVDLLGNNRMRTEREAVKTKHSSTQPLDAKERDPDSL